AGNEIDRAHDLLDDFVVGPIGMDGADERDDAGDLRCGHRGAADRAVVGAETFGPHRRGDLGGKGAENVDAGGSQIDGVRAVVGEIREVVGIVGGGDGNDVGLVVAGGKEGQRVIVAAVVT